MEDDVLDSALSQNTENLQLLFSQAPDLVIRRFPIGPSKTEAALMYLSGLTDKDAIHNYVLKPLMHSSFDSNKELPVTIGKIEMVYTWGQIENAILGGDSVLLLNGQITGYQLDTKGWPQRQLTIPQNEISLKGANQGFVETGSQNIALIRRYIPHQELILKEMTVGIRGKTKLSLLYLGDVASKEVLRELETRIQNITVDAVINTGELIEFIKIIPIHRFRK
ncbi:hypothetical protein J2Y02_003827 [Neobacillus drentensis]|nr:hypothetical protein [Neobacillus drentensis]